MHMNGNPQLILASASPRRRELLDQIGIQYRVVAADLHEVPRENEPPGNYVSRMAREKAAEIRRRERAGIPVLGADTEVIIDDRILGKPADRRHAVELLSGLSGRTHEVWSAVALALPDGQILEDLSVTRVTFGIMEPAWIECYCDSGDPLDKAGAYGVQGLAAQKIEWIDGSYSGVMGLPLFETSRLLVKAGLLEF
jgi:septum formation protein